MATTAHRRYAEIMRDVEELINDHIAHQAAGTHDRSKLKLLVPSVGMFFTPLLLHDAFAYQDGRRFISSRRFVPPSFNDIRLILNTAQVMSLTRSGPIELVTFDGDVTLYDDGQSLTEDNPVIPRILSLMSRGTKIGIVTAAGYTEARRYYERLHGLLDAIHMSDMPSTLKQNLIVMGGESNYLFKFAEGDPDRLKFVPRKEWLLDDMLLWQEEDITELLDVAEIALKDCIKTLRLEADVYRKERAVGIIPLGSKLIREQLEETVLVVQKILVSSVPSTEIFKRFAEQVAGNVFRGSPLAILRLQRRERRVRRHWRQIMGCKSMSKLLRWVRQSLRFFWITRNNEQRRWYHQKRRHHPNQGGHSGG